MLDVDPKKLNLIALTTMPLVAVFSSSIAIEVDFKAIATIFAINLIPMLVSSGIGYLLLGKAKTYFQQSLQLNPAHLEGREGLRMLARMQGAK